MHFLAGNIQMGVNTHTCKIRYAPIGIEPYGYRVSWIWTWTWTTGTQPSSPKHNPLQQIHTQSPKKHHQSRKPIRILPSPIIPNLRNKLDTPEHRANSAEHIGCDCHIAVRHLDQFVAYEIMEGLRCQLSRLGGAVTFEQRVD